MKKKLFLFSFCFLIVGALVVFFSREKKESNECAFCDSKILSYQRFYEDELVIALYTHKPMVKGHCLIIPKRHVSRFEDLSDEEILQMGKVVKKTHVAVQKAFGTKHYLLLQKNGKEVGQSVPHVHFHYIPKKEGDFSVVSFVAKLLIRPLLIPISNNDMKENREKIISAIADLEYETNYR